MYLQHLYPTPVSVREDPDMPAFRFGAAVTAYVTSAMTPDCAERLRAVWNRFCCTASVLEIRKDLFTGDLFDEKQTEETPFILHIGGTSFLASQPKLRKPEDSYAIRVTAEGVILEAKDEKTLIEGFMTLVQLIIPEDLGEGSERFSVTAAEVHDAPAIGMRAVHLCIFPESAMSTIEKAIHLAGFLKMTHVVLEFWGTYEYKTMRELSWRGKAHTYTEMKRLTDLIRSYGMEVIPMINHFGHATASRGGMGRHVVLNAAPRRAKLFEPDGWTWCLSNPDTWKLLASMREELYDLCGAGSYFHLGFDEAYSYATCPACRARVPYELLAEYVNRLTEDVVSKGRRPILWHDEFINGGDFAGKIQSPVVANGQSHNTAPALDLLDRRAIIADWQYDYKNGENATTRYFMDKGFDVILSPWDGRENIRSLCANAKDFGAYGVMLTTWHHLPAYLMNFPSTADMVWKRDTSASWNPLTESAAILRTLYDTDGDFDASGWNSFEVEQ